MVLEKKLRLFAAAASLAVGLGMGAPHAGQYPDRPIKMLVGYAPGGGSDILARVVAQKMTEVLGETVIVENKPGAGTTLAASILAKSKPDGYTIMQTSLATALGEKFVGKLAYDYSTDLVGVAPLGTSDFLLVVPPNSPANSFQEFIKLAKEKELTYSSSGVGAPSHLMAEELKSMLGLKLVHVPYNGSAPGLNALLAGEVDANFSNTPNSAPLAKDGTKLKALANTSRERSPLAPDVPTIDESGLKGFQAVAWYGLVVPKGTPDEIVKKLNLAVNEALKDENVVAKLAQQGFTLKTGTPDEFEAFSRSEIARWSAVADVALKK